MFHEFKGLFDTMQFALLARHASAWRGHDIQIVWGVCPVTGAWELVVETVEFQFRSRAFALDGFGTFIDFDLEGLKEKRRGRHHQHTYVWAKQTSGTRTHTNARKQDYTHTHNNTHKYTHRTNKQQQQQHNNKNKNKTTGTKQTASKQSGRSS